MVEKFTFNLKDEQFSSQTTKNPLNLNLPDETNTTDNDTNKKKKRSFILT